MTLVLIARLGRNSDFYFRKVRLYGVFGSEMPNFTFAQSNKITQNRGSVLPSVA